MTFLSQKEEKLLILNDDVQRCTKCSVHSKLPSGCYPLAGHGKSTSKIMIIGEAPGANEILLDRPFTGLAGRTLDNLLKGARINREECYITNTVKCRPTDDGKKNRVPSREELDNCAVWLLTELALVDCQVIFTLGKIPTYALLRGILKKTFKLTDVIGKEYKLGRKTVIPNLHPSYIMQYGKDKMDLAVETFRLAAKYV